MKTHKTVPTGISEVSTDNHRVVSRDEWVAERRALLAHEKELIPLIAMTDSCGRPAIPSDLRL